jgi:hypothetical protein
MRSTISICTIALAWVTALAAYGQSPRHTFIDLDTPVLGGPNSIAFGINAAGRVGAVRLCPPGISTRSSGMTAT